MIYDFCTNDKKPGSEVLKKAATDIDEVGGLRACAPYLFGAFALN